MNIHSGLGCFSSPFGPGIDIHITPESVFTSPRNGYSHAPESAKRDTTAAKRLMRKAIAASGNAMPRVMNVDKNPAYPAAVDALKAEGAIPRRVALRQCKYLNNVIEQDHRTVKKRVWLAKGYGTFQSAWRTIKGIETVHMIRKGRARWVAKGDAVGQALFIAGLFGLSA